LDASGIDRQLSVAGDQLVGERRPPCRSEGRVALVQRASPLALGLGTALLSGVAATPASAITVEGDTGLAGALVNARSVIV